MKHLLKIPQQKSNHSVSYLDTPLKLELTDIKIKNVLNHLIECHIPIKVNEASINKIKEIDELSFDTLTTNPDWLNKDQEIETHYYNSYSDDISHIYLFINNKTNCSFNGHEKDINEMLKEKYYIRQTDIFINGYVLLTEKKYISRSLIQSASRKGVEFFTCRKKKKK